MTHPFNPIARFLAICIVFVFCALSQTAVAQISHGGRPLPLNAAVGMRAVLPDKDLFVEMPPFDKQAALLRSEEEGARFKSLEFAHKFYVHLRPDNSGATFTAEGMNVWRVGIRSRGAYSLNILFTKFTLPPGAKVFVYNADQTEVLGSYTHENNTDLNLLPVQPVGGEELIVEYQEPVDGAFKGEIEIGEVNHDFLGIFRATEPRDPGQECHPNIVCHPEDLEAGRGVVALIINGTAYCTGSLVNNTSEDGTPYLLTATHCLNSNFSPRFLADRKYDVVAGTIVAFFHYDSPVCEGNIRGPLQMTLASADSVLISEDYDISLLRFKDIPPREYQPYYLGWNASASASAQPSFHGIHHPNGGVKKVAVDNDNLQTASFSFTNRDYGNRIVFETNAHVAVRAWDAGATEGGSSGSPLLERGKRIVGTLTGGESYCSSSRGPDAYASLNKFWNVEGSVGNPNPIRFYLDPENTSATQLNGYNPYAPNPLTRSQNFKTDETAVQTYHNSVPLFATDNTYGYTEFAEEFFAASRVELLGVFIASPPVSNIANLNVRIRVYAGENEPATLLHEQPFTYHYRYYENGIFNTASRSMRRNAENYLRFTSPISTSGKIFISYLVANNVSNGFSVLNAEPRKAGSGAVSTAWMKNAEGWVRSSENSENPVNTSFLISPYVNGNISVAVAPVKEDFALNAYYLRETGRIVMDSNRELVKWEVFDALGRKLHQGQTDESVNRVSYSAAHLPKGVYIVKVATSDGIVKSVKVMVR